MPGSLLHVGAQIQCMHGGMAQPTAPQARVMVGGQPVVTQPSPHSVAACSFSTPGGPMPCTLAQWTTPSTRVLIGGQPALLFDAQAVCVPNGTGVLVANAQVRVQGT